MKWLNLEKIKSQLRIEQDFTVEDSILMLYGESAESTLLNYINRSYEEVIETWGEIPAPLVQASLMLVDNSYQHRSPASPMQMYCVLYDFDCLVKPFMRLSDKSFEQSNKTNQYGCTSI